MSHFGQLSKFAVNPSKFVQFDLPEIGEGAALTVAPAGETNQEYFKAVLKAGGAPTKGMRQKKQVATEVTPEEVKKQRAIDREMFSKYVVKGFVKMVDEKEEPVPFNEANVNDLMNALPDWLFDELRKFCSDVGNFTDFEMDVEAKVKN